MSTISGIHEELGKIIQRMDLEFQKKLDLKDFKLW